MAASPNWTGPETTSPRSRSNRAPAPPVAGRIERMPLPFGPPGTERSLLVRRYGQPGARPKAYIQAGLHADEIPGLLVAQRLAALLEDVTVLGEVLLVPVANPIGLDQRVLGAAVGRYALDHGSNFNRGFTALEEPVARRVTGRLGADAPANVRLIREAMAETLRATAPADALAGWRQALLTLAVDADIVLDLHCDQDSVLHLYTGASLWPAAADLAGWLGCRTVLLADQSGGDPFDEACSAPWWRLAERFGPTLPVPPACLAATIELRGQRDVDPALADTDARALFQFLAGRGVVAGAPGPAPAPVCAATPLAGVERIKAPSPGIVCHLVALGDTVAPGQPVALLIDPTADPRAEGTLLVSRTAGVVWARALSRFARAGDIIASIAGPTALPDHSSTLLTP